MSIIKIREVKDLQLDLIDIGLSQARTSNIDEGIEELAASIEKIGLHVKYEQLIEPLKQKVDRQELSLM